MKKSIIAAGAASVALAAMPVVGVFAANDPVTGTVTDNIKYSLSEACTFAGGDHSAEIDLGTKIAGAESNVGTSAAMTITCNYSEGWSLKALATSLANPSQATPTYEIPFGAYATNGSSVWSAKIAIANASGNYTLTSGWDDFGGTMDTDEGSVVATTILTSKKDDSENVMPVVGMTVTPSYKAYTTADQQPGTYVGSMTYTFSAAE